MPDKLHLPDNRTHPLFIFLSKKAMSLSFFPAQKSSSKSMGVRWAQLTNLPDKGFVERVRVGDGEGTG